MSRDSQLYSRDYKILMCHLSEGGNPDCNLGEDRSRFNVFKVILYNDFIYMPNNDSINSTWFDLFSIKERKNKNNRSCAFVFVGIPRVDRVLLEFAAVRSAGEVYFDFVQTCCCFLSCCSWSIPIMWTI